MKKPLLGVSITIDSKEDILHTIEQYLLEKSSKTPFIIVTPNPEQIMLSRQQSTFLTILNHANIAIPDGAGLVWAMRFVNGVTVHRISGVDFVSDFVHLAHKHHMTIGCIGGRNGVAKKALAVLRSSYEELSGWAMEPEDMSIEKMATHIENSNTKIVFVGLGAPKQEQYIESLRKKCHHVVLMSVGGSFDIISGNVPRAPGWIQDMGLEWLYRLIREPWRLKRQTRLIAFVVSVCIERLFRK